MHVSTMIGLMGTLSTMTVFTLTSYRQNECTDAECLVRPL